MRFGLGAPRSRRTFMGNGSGVSRALLAIRAVYVRGTALTP